ncbi:MAG: DUF1700 domain-containing protein, partial [Oscillospiraceae bacterium]|nr:DUF1700 domain-containing protein [Oscillospiraceae bacterium]
MDKETYLRFLRALLMNRLPAADAEDIVRFYTEYLEEAGPDKEQEAMASLGSPEELTAKIMEQRAKEEAEGLREPEEPAPRAYTIPVKSGLPRELGIALVVLAGVCIVPTLGGLFIGFAVGGIALIVCGALMFALLGVLGGVLGSMLLGIGSGLVMISTGSLLVQAAKGMLYLMKKAMKGLWNVLVE